MVFKCNNNTECSGINANLPLLFCSHYAAFVKCAAFVMRVQNYRCSEATIQQMALNNYWHFSGGPASSDWSSHPSMSQTHFPPSSDYSDTMSYHDTSTMDSFGSSLYSSSDHSRTSSDQHSSSDHHSTTPELHSTFSDSHSASDYHGDTSAPSYGDHSSAPNYGRRQYESSLPYICMGKLGNFDFPLHKGN